MTPRHRSSSVFAAVAALSAIVVLAGCGSPTPSPSATSAAIASAAPSTSTVPGGSSPITSPLAPSPTEGSSPSFEPLPSASPGQTASPGATGGTWPLRTTWFVADVLFRPDGGVVVLEFRPDQHDARIVAVDASGATQPGWPWSAPTVEPIGGYPAIDAALSPDGAIVAVVGTAAGGHSVHRLDRAGREQPGYPVRVATNGFCQVPILAGSGTAYVTCDLLDTVSGNTVSAITYALRADGSTVPGWPITTGPTTQDAQLASNGTLYLGSTRIGHTRIAAIGPDGRTLAGWPRLYPSGATFTVGPASRLWMTWGTYGKDPGQCGPPVRTSYEVVGRDGKRVRGWPVSVVGWGSEPTVSADGTTYVATAARRMIAYSPTGKVKAGWPVAIPVEPAACYGGSSPQLAGSGTVLIAGTRARLGGSDGGAIAMVRASGRKVPGWPVLVPYELATFCRFCVPGPGQIIPPAIGARRIYLGAYSADRPRVVVFDRAGHRPPAAQRRLATARTWQLAWIRISPTGRVWTLIVQETGGAYLRPIAQDRALSTP